MIDNSDGDATVFWKAFHLPPRFGRQPRQHSFHGWMLGIRYRPLDLDTDDAALVGLSEFFNARCERVGENPFDPIIGALDAWIEYHLRPRFNAARSPVAEGVAALDGVLSAMGPDRGMSVASLAETAGVVPRTLQRRFRKRTRACAQAVCRRSALQRRVAASCSWRWKSGGYRVGSRLLRSGASDDGSGPARRPVAGPVSCAGSAAGRARRCPIFQRLRPSEPGTPPRLRFRRNR